MKTKLHSKPLVSCIVPTKNSERFLDQCLSSIKNQSYKNLEIIVIDNKSTDRTLEIAKKYTDKVFTFGPERSAQRNYGAKKSKGKYLFFIDSDMILSQDVIEECVERITQNQNIVGVIIPEESVGQGFWAECKRLERSFYVGVTWIEAARFFDKSKFQKIGGYDENMISGEDWDLSQRVEKLGKIGRIKSFIYHNEGEISLLNTVRKKFYYSKQFSKYKSKDHNKENIKYQTNIVARYMLYLSDPKKLFKSPFYGFGMLFMKTCEFFFGALGYLYAKIYSR